MKISVTPCPTSNFTLIPHSDKPMSNSPLTPNRIFFCGFHWSFVWRNTGKISRHPTWECSKSHKNQFYTHSGLQFSIRSVRWQALYMQWMIWKVIQMTKHGGNVKTNEAMSSNLKTSNFVWHHSLLTSWRQCIKESPDKGSSLISFHREDLIYKPPKSLISCGAYFHSRKDFKQWLSTLTIHNMQSNDSCSFLSLWLPFPVLFFEFH